MDKCTLLVIVFIIHIIGAIVTMFVHYKNGRFEAAAKNTDDIRFEKPSDIVFLDCAAWEVQFIIFTLSSIGDWINHLFSNKN